MLFECGEKTYKCEGAAEENKKEDERESALLPVQFPV